MESSKPLKVRLTLEMTVDVDGWRAEYLDNASRSDIREMVKSQALQAVSASWRHIAPVVRTRESER